MFIGFNNSFVNNPSHRFILIQSNMHAMVMNVQKVTYIDISDILNGFKFNRTFDLIIISGLLSNQTYEMGTQIVKKWDFILEDLRKDNINSIFAGFLNCDMKSKHFCGGYSNLNIVCKKYNIKHLIHLQKQTRCRMDVDKHVNFCKSWNFPWCINTYIFNKTNSKKEYDVIFFGDTSEAYPLRHKILGIQENRERLENMGIKIYIPQNFGNYYTDSYKTKYYGKKLAEEINKSKIGFTSSPNTNAFISKYFEYSACGIPIIGNMPNDGKSTFNKSYFHIDEDMDIEEIGNVFLNAIKIVSEDKLIFSEVHDKIVKEYNLESVMNECNNIINKILTYR